MFYHRSQPLIRRTLLALSVLTFTVQAGIITPVGTRGSLSGNDMIQWGTSADDTNPVTSPYARLSTGGGVTATANLVGGFTLWTNNAGSQTYTSNFTTGDIVLDTFGVDGPVTITFSTAVTAVGFQIQHNTVGSFNGTLFVYDSGNTLMGTVSAGGTTGFASDGSALFLGARSDLRGELESAWDEHAEGGRV